MRRLVGLWMLLCVCVMYATRLEASQVERIHKVQSLLGEVDGRGAQEIINDLNASASPEGQLQILEAASWTYRDLVEQLKVEGPSRKQWLYSMVLLNVAYLQFGGDINAYDSDLNVLIRKKLKSYMSDALIQQSGLFHSLE